MNNEPILKGVKIMSSIRQVKAVCIYLFILVLLIVGCNGKDEKTASEKAFNIIVYGDTREEWHPGKNSKQELHLKIVEEICRVEKDIDLILFLGDAIFFREWFGEWEHFKKAVNAFGTHKTHFFPILGNHEVAPWGWDLYRTPAYKDLINSIGQDYLRDESLAPLLQAFPKMDAKDFLEKIQEEEKRELIFHMAEEKIYYDQSIKDRTEKNWDIFEDRFIRFLKFEHLKDVANGHTYYKIPEEYTSGRADILLLDTNIYDSEEQLSWFEDEMCKIKNTKPRNKPVIVVAHHPPYTSGSFCESRFPRSLSENANLHFLTTT
jgi:hypothetical protein